MMFTQQKALRDETQLGIHADYQPAPCDAPACTLASVLVTH